MPAQKDPYLDALERLDDKLSELKVRVDVHEKRLSWLVSAALIVVGAVGGPDAIQAVTAAAG